MTDVSFEAFFDTRRQTSNQRIMNGDTRHGSTLERAS